MTRDWLKNDGAKSRVSELLTQAGVPLEIRVAEACRRFVKLYHRKHDVSVAAERVLYGSTGEQDALREIDQCVNLYQELEVGSQIGIQLSVQVPIECKHRDGLEVFGFPYHRAAKERAGIPVISDLVGARLVRQLGYIEPGFVTRQPLSAIGLLEIEHGKTPKRIYDENLIYKAGGAVYDFVKIEAATYAAEGGFTVHEVVKSMNLVDQFRSYLKKTRYHWSVFRRWLDNLPMNTFLEFNRRYFGGKRLYQMISVNCPLVCIDSPIYAVSLAGGRPKDFSAKRMLLTGVRVPGWPGRFRHYLARPTPEALVLVVSTAGLFSTLVKVRKWFDLLRAALVNANDESIARALLEATFFQSVIAEFDKEELATSVYRSDLDLGPM